MEISPQLIYVSYVSFANLSIIVQELNGLNLEMDDSTPMPTPLCFMEIVGIINQR
jgi:hypothetical protein